MCTTYPFLALLNRRSYPVGNHTAHWTKMILLVSQRTNNVGTCFHRDVSLFSIKCHSTRNGAHDHKYLNRGKTQSYEYFALHCARLQSTRHGLKTLTTGIQCFFGGKGVVLCYQHALTGQSLLCCTSLRRIQVLHLVLGQHLGGSHHRHTLPEFAQPLHDMLHLICKVNAGDQSGYITLPSRGYPSWGKFQVATSPVPSRGSP